METNEALDYFHNDICGDNLSLLINDQMFCFFKDFLGFLSFLKVSPRIMFSPGGFGVVNYNSKIGMI
jgi:hypothetical protein